MLSIYFNNSVNVFVIHIHNMNVLLIACERNASTGASEPSETIPIGKIFFTSPLDAGRGDPIL